MWPENPHYFDAYHRRSVAVLLARLFVSYRICKWAGQLEVAGRAAQISAHVGGPPSRGIEKYKPKVRTGWRVRASTRSSPDQMLSYLGIAEMPTLDVW